LENKNGQTMLPVKFLRQLIGFYGDHMQMIVPSFLEQSMIALVKEQERMREQMKAAFGASPMDMMKMQTPLQFIEEQTRRNMDMFNNAIRLFTPKNGETGAPGSGAGKSAEQKAPGEATELDELREQIAAMQRKIEKLGK
jgi:polyhydroxyalkanoate synthesis regulator protein